MTAPSGDPTLTGLPRAQSRWLMALARGPVRPMAWACAAPLCAGVLLIVQAWLLARVLGGVVQTG
ncbi:MAG: thiol reductant ABC exporter subunit CydD, partial [Comamonadaceae bacterium]